MLVHGMRQAVIGDWAFSLTRDGPSLNARQMPTESLINFGTILPGTQDRLCLRMCTATPPNCDRSSHDSPDVLSEKADINNATFGSPSDPFNPSAEQSVYDGHSGSAKFMGEKTKRVTKTVQIDDSDSRRTMY
jgi:hypothetical protein